MTGQYANTNLSNVTTANRTMNSTQLIKPLANSSNTYTADIVTGKTTSNDTREFLQTIQYTIDKGAHVIDNNRVATYWGIDINPGAGAAWARNIEMVVQPGSVNSGLTFVMGDEIDLENFDQDCGLGFTGLSMYGLSFGTGVSNKSITAASIVNSVSTNRNWQHGHIVFGGVTQESFCDYGNATYSFADHGFHEVGIQLAGGHYTAAAIDIPNNSPIISPNAANSANIEILRVDNCDNILIGSNAPGVIGLCRTVVASADNSYSLGTSTQRFSSVWAANGTIQTSDPKLKTDISQIPDVSALFVGKHAINPISFKWKIGGYDLIKTQEEQMVPVMQDIEITVPSVEIVDGKALHSEQKVQKTVPVYDTYPMYHQKTGEPVFGDDKKLHQSVHREVRKEKKIVDVLKHKERKGVRTHIGWDATQWSQVANLLGLPDFGGYVEDENGQLALRPDQIIPILWKQVQTLTEQVAQLMNKQN